MSVLATKLRIPRQRVNGVLRPRLTEKLYAAVEQPASVILLAGPPGFGYRLSILEDTHPLPQFFFPQS